MPQQHTIIRAGKHTLESRKLPGKLLGNLLGGMEDLLDGPANVHALTNKLHKIARELAAIL
jgi:hypothetical protein